MTATMTPSTATRTQRPRKVSKTASGKLHRVWGGGTRGRNIHDLLGAHPPVTTCGAWARAAGTTTATVSRILAGRRKPSLEMLRRLAKAGGVKVGVLLSGLGMETLPEPLKRRYAPPKGTK